MLTLADTTKRMVVYVVRGVWHHTMPLTSLHPDPPPPLWQQGPAALITLEDKSMTGIRSFLNSALIRRQSYDIKKKKAARPVNTCYGMHQLDQEKKLHVNRRLFLTRPSILRLTSRPSAAAGVMTSSRMTSGSSVVKVRNAMVSSASVTCSTCKAVIWGS